MEIIEVIIAPPLNIDFLLSPAQFAGLFGFGSIIFVGPCETSFID